MRAIFVTLVFLFTGCAKQDTPATVHPVIPRSAVSVVVPSAITGDRSYAVVDSAWLKSYYTTFRAELFRLGVTKWDGRFDCNHFASFYTSLAQTKFYADNFQSWTSAQSLAVGTFWYVSARGPHAIVVAITERGVVFIEPQTGQEITLTPGERQSAFLIVF